MKNCFLLLTVLLCLLSCMKENEITVSEANEESLDLRTHFEGDFLVQKRLFGTTRGYGDFDTTILDTIYIHIPDGDTLMMDTLESGEISVIGDLQITRWRFQLNKTLPPDFERTYILSYGASIPPFFSGYFIGKDSFYFDGTAEFGAGRYHYESVRGKRID